jgi:hypothetical protein
MVFDLGTATDEIDFDEDGGPFSESVVGYNGTSNEPTPIRFGSNLDEGSVVTLEISTLSGAGTSERIVVPQSLSGTSAVNL